MQVLCFPIAVLWCLVGYCVLRLQPPTCDEDYYTIEKYALRKPIKKKVKKTNNKKIYKKPLPVNEQNVEELYSKPRRVRKLSENSENSSSAVESGYYTLNPLSNPSSSHYGELPEVPDKRLLHLKSSNDKLAILNSWFEKSLTRSVENLSNNKQESLNQEFELKTVNEDDMDAITTISADTLSRLANLRKCDNVVSG